MIGSLTGGQGIGNAASLAFAQQGSTVALAGLASFSGGEGAGGLSGGEGGQSSASISGPGQLVSELQQLQQQNPTEFQQIVSQIAKQLESAAQQAGQGQQGTLLSDLAQKFQNVANGGDLSQLLPSQPANAVEQTYGQSGSVLTQAASTQTSAYRCIFKHFGRQLEAAFPKYFERSESGPVAGPERWLSAHKAIRAVQNPLPE